MTRRAPDLAAYLSRADRTLNYGTPDFDDVSSFRLLSVCLAALLVAGCSGTATKTTIPPTTSAPPPVVTADTGSISGVVTDEELVPLAKVGVVVAENENLSTESDTAGKFTLNDVPPGDHSIIIARAGYETATREVTVLAGETLEVTMTLKSLIIVKPHVEHFVDEGHIPFAFATPSVLFGGHNALGEYVTHFEHDANPGTVAVIATGTWDRSTPLTATRMYVAIKVEADTYAAGITPVTARLFNVSLPAPQKVVLDFGMTQVCTDVVSCVEDPPNRVAQVVYDQRTTLYTDVYYVDQPAPDAVAGQETA